MPIIEREAEFCICSGSEIVKKVNEKLSQGWRLHGTLFHTSYKYIDQVPEGRYGSYREVEKTGNTFHGFSPL